MKTKIFVIQILLSLVIGCVSKTDNQKEEDTPLDSSHYAKEIVDNKSPSNVNFSGIDSLHGKKNYISKVDSTKYPNPSILNSDFSSGSYESLRDYGRGLALVKGDSIVKWDLEFGDYNTHTYIWLDFDNDGDKDLYTFSGEEDMYSSKLYLNDEKLLKVIYENNLTYCPVIDIDKDGIPEILNSNNIEIREVDYDNELNLTEDQYSIIFNEYDSIVGEFDQYNFNYNMPDLYKLFAMDILSPVSILTLVDGKMKDVSDNYSEHYCFRKSLLQSIKSPSRRVEPIINTLISEYSKICKKNN